MVDPKDPVSGNGNLGSAGNGGLPDALVSGSAALASPAGTGASPLAGPVGDADDVPQDEEREVDWGGTKRKMKVSELVGLARQAEEARAIKAAADLQLREVAALKGVADRLRKANPQEREAFRRWAQGDSSALSAPAPRGHDQDQDDLLDDGGSAGTPARSSADAVRIDKLERALMQVLDVMQGQVDERRHIDTVGQVEAAMKQFPVFDGSPTLAKQAKAAILDRVSRGDGENLLGVVTDLARQSQAVLDEVVGRGQAPQARGIPELRPGSLKPRSAKELQDGTVDRDVINRLLGNRR